MQFAGHDPGARRTVAAQWAGVLGPPVIWALRFGLNYGAMPLACAADAVWLFHVANLLAVLAIAGLGVLAWRFWRTAGGRPPAAGPERVWRTGFMGLLGVFSALLFLVVVLAESLAVLMIDPCLTAGPLVPH